MSYVTAAQLASETNPTGASLVGFLQSGTSAVGRTLQDKLQEFVSVKDFGAHGDGSTDDTAAIQAAINAAGSGRGVFFPGGTYLLSATLTVSNGEVTLFGENMFGCELLQTSTGLNILDVTGAYFRLHGLSFYYSATPVFPATAISLNVSDAELSSFVVRNAWVGVSVQGGGNLILRDFQIGDFGSIGLLFNNSGAGGAMVSNFTINAGSSTAGASGCVVFSDQVEGVILAHGEILEGVNSAGDVRGLLYGRQPPGLLHLQ